MFNPQTKAKVVVIDTTIFPPEGPRFPEKEFETLSEALAWIARDLLESWEGGRYEIAVEGSEKNINVDGRNVNLSKLED
jgi:hypothetical protein